MEDLKFRYIVLLVKKEECIFLLDFYSILTDISTLASSGVSHVQPV